MSTDNRTKARTFLLTINPTNGVGRGSDLEKKLVRWIQKADYYCVVSELEGARRHIHAQLWYDKARNINDIKKSPLRICSQLVSPWGKNEQAKCVHMQYACSDVFKSYLIENENKPDPPEVLAQRVPEVTEGYYPTPEELKALKDKKAERLAMDNRYHKLETLFNRFCDENDQPKAATYLRCAEALAWMMYTARVICVLRDDRTMRQTAKNMSSYIRRSQTPTFLSAEDLETWREMKNEQI